MNDFLANFADHPWLTLAFAVVLAVGYAIVRARGYNEGLREGLTYQIHVAVDEFNEGEADE